MDTIIEILLEIVLDFLDSGAKEVAMDNKCHKAVRIAAVVVLLILYLSVFGLIALGGIILFKKSAVVGILFFAFDIFLIAFSVRKVVRTVRKLKRSKKSDERDALV